MLTRKLIPAFLLAGALLVLAADDARADPFGHASSRTGLAFGPPVHVGIGVNFPIGQRRHRHHVEEVVEYEGGYYETQTREVRVAGEQIGWDMRGRPLFGPERIEVQEYRVWIPRRAVVRRVVHHHHPRPRGYVTVGGRVRIH